MVKSGYEKTSLAIPSSIFKNRKLSVLEAITVYLRDKKSMTYAEIARLLNRNDRTVWTSYQRAKKKVQSNKSNNGKS